MSGGAHTLTKMLDWKLHKYCYLQHYVHLHTFTWYFCYKETQTITNYKYTILRTDLSVKNYH